MLRAFSIPLELELLPSPSQCMLPDHSVGPADLFERIDCD